MGAGLRQSGGTGRGSRRRAGGAKPMSEINVTPFVDVMLVLLIIFMVAAPLLTVGVPLDLPKTRANPLPTEREEPLTVSIDAAGRVFIQTTEVLDRATLVPKLTAIAETRDSKRVFLRADGAVPHGLVARVMADISAGGFDKIGLIQDQDRGDE